MLAFKDNRIYFIMLIGFMVLFCHKSFGQTGFNKNKTIIYRDKNSGKLYLENDIDHTSPLWLNSIKYIYKMSGDTVYYYLDESGDEIGILNTIDSMANINIGKVMPVDNFIDIYGVSYTPQMMENKVIVLNFWSTTCRPCIAEMEELNDLVTDYDSKNVLFIAPTSESDTSKLKRFLTHKRY